MKAALVGLSTLALVSTGCAGLVSPGSSSMHAVDLDQPHMRSFAVASMTDLERDVRLETSDRDDNNEKLTPALFWTGIVAGTLGAAGSVGFGIAGYVTKNQLHDGYEDGGMDLGQRDALVKRGEAFNSVAIAASALAVVGYALAIVTYGVDWNRCGPLSQNEKKDSKKKIRRHCDELE